MSINLDKTFKKTFAKDWKKNVKNFFDTNKDMDKCTISQSLTSLIVNQVISKYNSNQVVNYNTENYFTT